MNQPWRSGNDLSWLPFLYSTSPSWFCPVQNRACTHHQSGKGVYAQVWLIVASYNRLYCASLSHNSVWYVCMDRKFMNPNELLRVPWLARRSNQSILKESNPEYSLKGLMLKIQYFGHLMWTANSLEKDPDAWKDWRQKEKRETEDEMVGGHHWVNGHDELGANSIRWWGTGKPGMLQPLGSQRVGHYVDTEQQQQQWAPGCLNLLEDTAEHQGHMCWSWRSPCG